MSGVTYMYLQKKCDGMKCKLGSTSVHDIGQAGSNQSV